jgi:hypothetical protein
MFYKKYLLRILIFTTLITITLSTITRLNASPPKPDTFVPNRGLKPSINLAEYIRANIGHGTRNLIIIWNRKYDKPAQQIADLMILFRYLSDTPKIPIQMLSNEEFELDKVLDTKKMIKILKIFQANLNHTYKTLFEYSSLIIGSKYGNIEKEYKRMLKDMQRVINSYNSVAKVTNSQYNRKVLPYYKLNYKR